MVNTINILFSALLNYYYIQYLALIRLVTMIIHVKCVLLDLLFVFLEHVM